MKDSSRLIGSRTSRRADGSSWMDNGEGGGKSEKSEGRRGRRGRRVVEYRVVKREKGQGWRKDDEGVRRSKAKGWMETGARTSGGQ